MRKIIGITLLSLALSFAFLNTNQAFATNLFEDPGFNNGVNNWSAIGYPFTAQADVYHTGPYAAKNTITNVSTQDYYGQIYQIIQPYASGEPVYLEGWVKTDFAVGSTARAGILVEFLDSANQPITGTSIKTEMAGVNDWFKIYVTGTAPAGTTKLRAGAFIFATQGDSTALNGSAYVDDMFIDKITTGLLINNPGFEQLLSNWTTGVGSYPFAANSAVAHSGAYSASDLIDTVTGQSYFGFIYQNVSLPVGSPIYASAWGKSDISELALAKGGLVVQFLNASNGIISELKSEIGGRTDWRQLYVSGTVPSQTTTIKVGGFLYAPQNDSAAVNGLFYIDDFVVSTSYLPPPPPPTNLINQNFENGVNDWAWVSRPFVATNSVVHSGTFAAQHTIGTTEVGIDYWSEIYQEFPYTAGRAAYLTGWAKTAINPLKNAVGGLQIQFYNSSGVPLLTIPAKAEIGGNTDWSFLYVTTQAPAGTVKIRISGYAWAFRGQGTINGNVYLDDFSFSDTPPSDLILNPGFENAFSGWTLDPTGFLMTNVTEDFHSGANSAKATIQVPEGSAPYWSRTYQEFSVAVGQTIYSTLWAKTNIPANSAAKGGLLVEFLNSAGEPIGLPLKAEIGGQTGWTYLYVTGVAPNGTVKARVGPFLSSTNADASFGGIAYFDDVVASFDALPPPAFPTTLSNTGFENGQTGWTDLYGPPSVIDNIGAHSGTYSAKKTFVAIPNDNYFSIIYQDIYYNNQATPFPADRPVYLTAYLKSSINPAASAQVGIKLEYFDALNVAHEIATDQVSANNPWRRLYVSGSIPAGAARVRVSGFAYAAQDDPYAYAANTTVNFDDFVYSYENLPLNPNQTQLLNGGFENGLNDWDVFYRPAIVTTEAVHSGTYAARFLIVEVQTDEYRGELRQEISVGNRAIVTAKVWAKTLINPLSLARAGLEIIFLDSAGNILGGAGPQTIGGNTDWTQLQVSARAPTGTVKARYVCTFSAPRFDPNAANGKAYFDDASLSITITGGPPIKIPVVNSDELPVNP